MEQVSQRGKSNQILQAPRKALRVTISASSCAVPGSLGPSSTPPSPSMNARAAENSITHRVAERPDVQLKEMCACLFLVLQRPSSCYRMFMFYCITAACAHRIEFRPNFLNIQHLILPYRLRRRQQSGLCPSKVICPIHRPHHCLSTEGPPKLNRRVLFSGPTTPEQW